MKYDLSIVMGGHVPDYYCHKKIRPVNYELQLMEQTDLYLHCNGREMHLEGSYYWVSQPGTYYKYGPWKKGVRWNHRYMVMFGRRCDLWAELGLIDDIPKAIPLKEMKTLTGLFDEVLELSKEPGPYVRLKCANILENFLLKMHETGPQKEKRPPWLEDCLQQLDGQNDYVPDYEKMAKQYGISLRTLQRSFKQYQGITLHGYYMQNRIEYAKYLLLHTTITQAAIAEQLCFSDEFHFARTFKRATGMSPGMFRKTIDR